jgi:Fe-S cluster assembly iron-binding protein IscA
MVLVPEDDVMLEGEEVQVAVDPHQLPFVEHGLSEVE